MKPAPFSYHRARTLAEAAELLADEPGALVLAGGQSLVPELNTRARTPPRLVDIGAVAELDRLERSGPLLHVGARVTHARIEHDPGPGTLGRLLGRVSRFVAHPPIRARGTFVGSLAYAHPAAEWPALALALDVEVELVSAAGSRVLAAERFFQGPFTTACAPGELVREARLPLLPDRAGVGFLEHRRTQASFALAAALCVVELEGERVASARIGLAGAGDRPLRARAAEALLVGEPAGPEAFAAAADAAAAASDPRPEPHCSPAYRRHVVAVLVRRALAQAAAEAAACA